MRRIALLFFAFFAFALNSCIENTGVSSGMQAEQSPSSTLTTGQHQGIFIEGKGVFLCPSGILYPSNESGAKKIQNKCVKSLSESPKKGTPLYVEIQAGLSEQSNKIEIISVDSIGTLNAFNTCVPYDFWCSGTEPFWDFVISEKLGLAQCYDFGKLSLDCQYTKPSLLPDGTTQYIFPIKGKTDKVEVLIKKQTCSDGMSERDFAYTVEVRSPDKVFQGCADTYGAAKME